MTRLGPGEFALHFIASLREQFPVLASGITDAEWNAITTALARELAERDQGPRGSDVPCTNEGSQYLHCKLCIDAWRDRDGNELVSPRDYARLSVAMTEHGFQVWCIRHDVNVIHIDFEGVKHPANLERVLAEEEVDPRPDAQVLPFRRPPEEDA